MQRLLELALVTALMTATSTSASEPKGRVIFYLDGRNSGDGMDVDLNFDKGYLRVVDVVFPLGPCKKGENEYCVSTDYLSFSWPTEEKARWQLGENEFEVIGHTKAVIGSEKYCLTIVASKQKTGDFEIYFNQELGLVGWKLKPATPLEAGQSFEYMRIQ